MTTSNREGGVGSSIYRTIYSPPRQKNNASEITKSPNMLRVKKIKNQITPIITENLSGLIVIAVLAVVFAFLDLSICVDAIVVNSTIKAATRLITELLISINLAFILFQNSRGQNNGGC
jgi:hypothetical protein